MLHCESHSKKTRSFAILQLDQLCTVVHSEDFVCISKVGPCGKWKAFFMQVIALYLRSNLKAETNSDRIVFEGQYGLLCLLVDYSEIWNPFLPWLFFCTSTTLYNWPWPMIFTGFFSLSICFKISKMPFAWQKYDFADF